MKTRLMTGPLALKGGDHFEGCEFVYPENYTDAMIVPPGFAYATLEDCVFRSPGSPPIYLHGRWAISQRARFRAIEDEMEKDR